MRIKKVTSYVKPSRIDSESSPTTIYVNKNITVDKKVDMIDGLPKEMNVYTYDMYMYTRAEFELIEQFIAQDEEMEHMKHTINTLEKSVAELTRVVRTLV